MGYLGAKVVGALAGASLLAAGSSGAGSSALAQEADWEKESSGSVERILAGTESRDVRVANVQGSFSSSQDGITPNEQLASVFRKASAALCGAEAEDFCEPGREPRAIAVCGAVSNAFVAQLDELDDDPVQLVMGCSCGGNPADGRAVANAEVAGVSIASIMERACVAEEANTVTFESADGYEVSLPLSYVMQRHSLIVHHVNGEDVKNVLGGTNQLWLGATSARYFAKDVVRIAFSIEEEVPAAPGTAEAKDQYANRPNIGILEGSVG